jgi:hypothetical protein
MSDKKSCQHAGCRKRAVRMLNGLPWCAKHSPNDEWGGATDAERWPIAPDHVPRLRALHADPGLLDPRGTMALYRVLLEQQLRPSPEYMERRALLLVVDEWTEDEPPTVRDIKAHHREEVLRRLHAENMSRVARYQEALTNTAKIDKVRETVLQRVAPVFGMLGVRLSRVIDDLITDEVLAERLRATLERELMRALGEADRLADGAS